MIYTASLKLCNGSFHFVRFAQNEMGNGSYSVAEEDVEETGNDTMIRNHEKYRVTVSWIRRGIHKGMQVR